RRHFQAERPGGLEVDGQLILGRCLHRKVGRFLAVEDAIDVAGGARMKPVTLPPGRASVSTKPAPTGSATCTNTIGTVRVACRSGSVVALLTARMTSGASATNSAAYLRTRSGSLAPQRISMRTLRPSIQPDCASACANARTRVCSTGSSDAKGVST